MLFRTDRIYTSQNGELVTRSGEDGLLPPQLEFDPGNPFYHSTDSKGPLHVTEGLQPGDVAVFLKFNERSDQPTHKEIATGVMHDNCPIVERTVGYIVVQNSLEHPGQGILVSDDLIEAYPSSYTTNYVVDIWNNLSRNDYDPAIEFTLPSVGRHIHALNARAHSNPRIRPSLDQG